MATTLLLLIVGLIGLWIGASLAVKGMSNLAASFKISPLFIGLTVASIGTSIPEIAISIMGGLDRLKGIETSGIVVGNAVGSAINLITILLGLVVLFSGTTLIIKKKEWRREGTTLLAAIAILFVLALDGELSRFDGLIMVIVYLFYFYNLVREERVREKLRAKRPQMHLFWDVISLVGGFVLVILMSDLVVNNSVILAQQWGIAETLIGIFIIGLGTGLPELAISLNAIFKGEAGLSVGNLVGSNIVDLLLALGAGTVISGFVVDKSILSIDIPVLFLVTLTMLIFFRTKFRLNKKEAIILVSMYLAYAIFRLLPIVF